MKTYTAVFGTSADTRTSASLAPTFILFYDLVNGATVAPPSISEAPAGFGIYKFQWGTTTPIGFLLDGATTGLGSGRYLSGQLDPSDRSDEYGNTMITIGTTLIGYGVTSVALGTTSVALGVTNVALGTSNIALGTSNIVQSAQAVTLITNAGITLVGIGNTAAFFGNSSALFSFIGSTASSFGNTATDPGTLFGFLKRAQELLEGNNVYTKSTGALQFFSRGSSTQLAQKTISDTSTQTTKT